MKLIFLYSIRNFTKNEEFLRRISSVFETAISENTYWLIPYMYSYYEVSSDLIPFASSKKCQNHLWKIIIFS